MQTIFVNVIIHNGNQQVLLVRRALNDEYLPGYLELPGGRVNPAESLEKAVLRKLSDDLNLSDVSPLYYASIADKDSKGPYVRTIFELGYDQNKALELTKSHVEYMWLDYDKIPEENIITDVKSIIEQYLGEHKKYSIEEKITTFTIHSDGGSRGNPGPSASAYIIYNEFNEILESGGSYIGITTNNLAEYTGVLLGLKAVTKFADRNDTILFNADSLLVVNQMNGLYKIKNRELWPINQEIRELMTQFKQVRFSHVPRELNVAADSKVNEILDAHV